MRHEQPAADISTLITVTSETSEPCEQQNCNLTSYLIPSYQSVISHLGNSLKIDFIWHCSLNIMVFKVGIISLHRGIYLHLRKFQTDLKRCNTFTFVTDFIQQDMSASLNKWNAVICKRYIMSLNGWILNYWLRSLADLFSMPAHTQPAALQVQQSLVRINTLNSITTPYLVDKVLYWYHSTIIISKAWLTYSTRKEFTSNTSMHWWSPGIFHIKFGQHSPITENAHVANLGMMVKFKTFKTIINSLRVDGFKISAIVS